MNVIFYTLGCKVNQYETQAMREEFLKRGFTDNSNILPDAVIINSCSVTAESDRKTRQLLNKARRKFPNAVITLTGCSVQAFPKDYEISVANVVIGNKDVKKVVDETCNALNNKSDFYSIIKHTPDEIYNTLPISSFEERTRAFMKIEDGCERYCSYCIIPFARGKVRSRSIESIKAEAENLSKNGFKEIVLVGINLSAYGTDIGKNLCDAVDTVCSVDGILRVRLGSLEPDHITEEMLKRFKVQDKFCEQFHLSLQSGCDNILKRMNRHYDSAFYYDLITKIRNVFENASITTDIMVGFAGETQEEFRESLAFAKKVKFARAHIFCYSRRTGTVAAALKDQVTNAEKQNRSKQMTEVTKETETEFLKSQVGKTFTVLLENKNTGYTKNYSRVKVLNSNENIGTVINVKITDTENEYLIGEII